MQHERVKNIFKLVDYLHSEIKTFNDCENLISEIQSIKDDLIRLEKSTNFFDKTKVDEYKKQLPQKIEIYDTKIITPISNKLIELELYDPNRYETVFNDNQAAINAYANDIANVDLEQVESAKNKYLEFRESINNLCFDRSFIFKEADNFLPLLGAVLNKLFLIFSVSEDEKKALDYSFSFVKAKPNTPPPIPETKPFEGLLMELNNIQLDNIFKILTTGYKYTIDCNNKPKEKTETIKYIEADIDSFKYVFGGKDKPENFQPIKFLGSKQILRQILTELQKEVKRNKHNPETRELSNEIKRRTLIYFIDSKNKPFKLANNDNRKSNNELIDYILANI